MVANPTPLKILICGDRNWTDIDTIVKYLRTIDESAIIIHGAARGADSIAGLIAEELGMTVKSYPAQWKRYGKQAGPIRNMQMFDAEYPDIVVAFHNDLPNSKGTKHMISYAQRKNTPTICIKTGDL